MTDTPAQNRQRTKARVSLVASILIGLVLLASGTGKIIGYGEVPGQTIEFLGHVIPMSILTPGVVFFLYDILIPYIIPWVELVMGCFLIIGFAPRLMAVISLPLTLVFMGNNLWAISRGMAKFPTCECFGIWEEIFGGLTPVQSLGIDIGLFALALIIIFVHPSGFLSSRKWLANLGKKKGKPGTDSTER